MQNFRTKARASSGIFSGKKVAACMLSVAVAAVIFWGITLTGNTEHSDEQMTVAQALLKEDEEIVTGKFLGAARGGRYAVGKRRSHQIYRRNLQPGQDDGAGGTGAGVQRR